MHSPALQSHYLKRMSLNFAQCAAREEIHCYASTEVVNFGGLTPRSVVSIGGKLGSRLPETRMNAGEIIFFWGVIRSSDQPEILITHTGNSEWLKIISIRVRVPSGPPYFSMGYVWSTQDRPKIYGCCHPLFQIFDFVTRMDKHVCGAD